MADYERIRTAIWSDPPFAALTANGKLLYLWTFTTKLGGRSGVYQARDEEIILYTGLTPKQLQDAQRELSAARMTFFSGGWIWVRARVKNLPPGPGVAAAVVREIGRLDPAHPFRVAFVAEYRESWLHKAEEAGGSSPASWAAVVEATGELRSLQSPTGGPTPEGPPFPVVAGDSGSHPPSHLGETGVSRLRSGSPPDPSDSSEEETGDARASSTQGEQAVRAVWDHYVAVFYPDGKHLPQLRTWRRHIVAALRVATVEECKRAIDGLATSTYHRDGGWTEIKYALHGNRSNGETDRQRIEQMMKRAGRAAGSAPAAPARDYGQRSEYDTYDLDGEEGAAA